jgi:hypothetical protein
LIGKLIGYLVTDFIKANNRNIWLTVVTFKWVDI